MSLLLAAIKGIVAVFLSDHRCRRKYRTQAPAEHGEYADHQVTMNVYVHPKKENVAKAGQMMDELLSNGSKTG